MDIEQKLRAGLAPPDPGPAFTAGVMAQIAGHGLSWRRRSSMPDGVNRRRSRRIVIGSLAAMGVAAAMLALKLAAPVPEVSMPVAVAAGSLPAPALSVSPPVDAAGKSLPTAPSIPPATPAAPKAASGHYTVMALPPQHQTQDPAAREHVERFYATLLDGIRKVPGLVLVDQDAVPSPDHPVDFVLTVTSLPITIDAAGMATYQSTENGAASGGMTQAAARTQWPVEVKVAAAQSAARRYLSIALLRAPGMQNAADCAQMPRAFFSRLCAEGQQQAGAQVEKLSATFLPPDRTTQQGLVGKLRDSSRDEAERVEAMEGLLSMHRRGLRLDSDAAAAIAAFVATQSASERAQSWKRLRDVTHPLLQQALLESLRQDADEKVRLEALATLAAGYLEQPGVRAALEAVAREDRQQIVQMATRRVVQGETEWRNYVEATLRDDDLNPATRLAPLVLQYQLAGSNPADIADFVTFVKRGDNVSLLVKLVDGIWRDPAQAETASNALRVLEVIPDAAVADFSAGLVQSLQQRKVPGGVLFAVLGVVNKHQDDARVRKGLQELGFPLTP